MRHNKQTQLPMFGASHLTRIRVDLFLDCGSNSHEACCLMLNATVCKEMRILIDSVSRQSNIFDWSHCNINMYNPPTTYQNYVRKT